MKLLEAVNENYRAVCSVNKVAGPLSSGSHFRCYHSYPCITLVFVSKRSRSGCKGWIVVKTLLLLLI